MLKKLVLIVLFFLNFKKFKLERRSDFFNSRDFFIPIKFFELLEDFVKSIKINYDYRFIKIEGWSLNNDRIVIDPPTYKNFKKKRLRKDVFFNLGKGMYSGFSFLLPINSKISITLDQKDVPVANIALLSLVGNTIILKFPVFAPLSFIDSFYPVYRFKWSNNLSNFIDNIIVAIFIRNIGILVRYSSRFNFIEISSFCQKIIDKNFVMDELQILRSSKNLTEISKGWKEIIDTSPKLDYQKYEIKFNDEHLSQNVFKRTILSSSESILGEVPNLHFSCEVYPNGLITKDGAKIHYDDSQNLHSDFNAGIHQMVVKNIYSNRTFVRRLPEIKLTEISSISSKDDSNYFHFLIESLPKLFYDGKLNIPQFPLIVNSSTPRQFSDLIRTLLPNDLVTLPVSSMIQAGIVELFNPITCLPDSELIPNNFSSYINENAVTAFKSYILENYCIQTGSKIDKIIFHRKSSRRMCLNSEQVLEIANSQGFVTVDPAQLSLLEQFSLINNAREVINFGGAAMANFIFAKKDTKIITLLSSNLNDFHIPAILSKIAQANHFYIMGNAVKSSKPLNIYEKQHIDYQIQIDDLLDGLNF